MFASGEYITNEPYEKFEVGLSIANSFLLQMFF